MLNDRLFELLQVLDSDELDQVWSYLGKDNRSDEFDRRTKEQKIEPLSRAIRHVAAHSIADLVRRRGAHEYAWNKILHQIADKLDIKTPTEGGERALEDALLQTLSTATESVRSGSTLRDAQKAAAQALDDLKSSSRWRNYKSLRLVGSIGSLRPMWGPNYRKLVPAVLFVLSAARTHEALKEAIECTT